jgi:hypothetical protein
MERSPELFLWPGIGGLLALVCLFFSLRAAKRRRLIENLPTCKTTGVFIGLVELKGTAEAESPLISYLAHQPCVHYTWTVEEHWSRTVTESYTDSKGNRRTRTRRESGWKTVANGGEQIPFYLRDDCGVLRIVPEGAKIEPTKIFSAECTPADALYYGKGPEGAVAHSDHRRRFVEQAIPLHAQLYVVGQAREREDIVAAEIAHDANAPLFLISTRSEGQVTSGMRWTFWLLGLLGLVLCVAGWIVRDGVLHRDLAAFVPTYLIAGGAFLVAWAIGWTWAAYNGLVDLRQRVQQAWSNVDVQLKRRNDLIPNLVHAVEGMRDHERNLQTELAQLRAQLLATPPGEPGPNHEGVAKTLFAVMERYPDLKANESFLSLQENLSETEQRIALARGYFNDIATFYNTRLQIIPDRLVAALGAMKPRELMTATGFERAPVVVNLAS